MDNADRMYLATMCSMIQELMNTRNDIDARIYRLLDELSDTAWFSEFTSNNDEYQHRMD